MADITAEHLPPQLQLFSPNEVTSRFYWKNHPLTRDEGCVVLIGGGAVSTALLERALLTNVFETGRRVSYHVFGGGREFAALHPEIMKARLVVDNPDSTDRMTLNGEVPPNRSSNTDTIVASIRDVTKLRGEVAFHSPGALPNDGKVIDDLRKLE
jgi:hypothetical protein